MSVELPTSAAVTSGTTTNAQQKLNFAALFDFVLGYLGAEFGIGPQTVASAASVDLNAVTDTRDLVISGTTAITGFVVEAGKVFRCRASGAFTLTNNSGIVTQRGDIKAAAGDTFMLRATALNVVEILFYTTAVIQSQIRLNGANGYGSTNDKIRRFTNITSTVGSDITYADSSTLGASLTINTPGKYAISYSDNFNAAASFGISLNTSQPTVAFGSITVADKLDYVTTGDSDFAASAHATMDFVAGDVIRPHTAGTAGGSATQTLFTISRVA